MDRSQIPEHLQRFSNTNPETTIPDNVEAVAPPTVEEIKKTTADISALANLFSPRKVNSIWFVYGHNTQPYPVAMFRSAEECIRHMQDNGMFYMGYSVIEWPFDTPAFEDVKQP